MKKLAADDKSVVSANNESRQAVETAIEVTKGDRNTTWERLARGGSISIKQWDTKDEVCAGEDAGNRKD